MRNAREFDPAAVIRALSQQQVDYVAVGVFGAIVLGSALTTDRVAIVTSTTQSQAIGRVRLDLESLAEQLEVHEASDSQAVQRLKERASVVSLYETVIPVAALSDIIEMMTNSRSLADQAALPHLYALEDEIAALERERRQ